MILSFILVWFAKWSMVFFCLIFHALFDCHIYIFMLLYCCLKFFCLYQYWVFFIFFSLHKMTKIISLWLKLGFGDILSPFFCLIIPYYILWCILGILYLGNQHATIIYVYKKKNLYIIRLIYMTIHFELHIKWRSVSYFL